MRWPTVSTGAEGWDYFEIKFRCAKLTASQGGLSGAASLGKTIENQVDGAF
jgi:hypothetical protein